VGHHPGTGHRIERARLCDAEGVLPAPSSRATAGSARPTGAAGRALGMGTSRSRRDRRSLRHGIAAGRSSRQHRQVPLRLRGTPAKPGRCVVVETHDLRTRSRPPAGGRLDATGAPVTALPPTSPEHPPVSAPTAAAIGSRTRGHRSRCADVNAAQHSQHLPFDVRDRPAVQVVDGAPARTVRVRVTGTVTARSSDTVNPNCPPGGRAQGRPSRSWRKPRPSRSRSTAAPRSTR
jgi:hypothetical protein